MAIIIGAQTGDGLQLAWIDSAIRVEDAVVNVHGQDFADDQVGGQGSGADGNDLQYLAFEVNLRFRQTGRLDFRGRFETQAGEIDFAFSAGSSLEDKPLPPARQRRYRARTRRSPPRSEAYLFSSRRGEVRARKEKKRGHSSFLLKSSGRPVTVDPCLARLGRI